MKSKLLIAALVIIGFAAASRLPRTIHRQEKGGTTYVVEKPLIGGPRTAFEFGEWGSRTGTITDSGKRHGQWFYCEGAATAVKWFWYGEEVTEGRWHELSGR